MVGKYTRIAKKLDKGIATFDEVREMGSKGGLANKAKNDWKEYFSKMAKKSNEVQSQDKDKLHQNRVKAQKLSVISRNRNKQLRQEEGIDI
jgi:hypothetical protein